MTLDAALISTLVARLEQLEQEQQIHRAIAEKLPVAYLYLDCHATIHFASQVVVNQLYCDRDQCLGRSLLSWLSPREGDRLLAEIARLNREHPQDSQPFPQRLHIPGQGVQSVMATLSPLPSSGNSSPLFLMRWEAAPTPSLGVDLSDFEPDFDLDDLDDDDRRSRLQQLALHIRGMIFDYVLHPDGRDQVPYVSSNCEEIFELSAADIQADTGYLWRVMDTADIPFAQQAIARSAKTLTPWNFEWRINLPSGRKKWLQGISYPHRHPDGRVIWNGIVFEITDRKQAEEDLYELAQRLLTIIETVEEGITLSDDADNFGLFNAKMAEITGYSGTEAQESESFLATLYPDAEAFAEAADRLVEVRQKGCLRNLETTIRAKDGSLRTLLVSTTYLPLSERNCYLSAYRDITQRRQAYEQLRQSQEFIEAIANASPQILYTIDVQSLVILSINGQVNAILGYSPKCLCHTVGAKNFSPLLQWQRLCHPEDIPRLQAYFAAWQDLDDGEVSEFEYRLRHADGSYRWLRSRDVVFKRDQMGKVQQILGTASDITEHQCAEAALRASEAALRASQERLNGILGSLDDAVWSMCPQTMQLLYVSPAVQRLYGRSAEKLARMKNPWMRNIHPGDRASFVRQWRQLKVEGSVDIEYRILVRRPDNESGESVPGQRRQNRQERWLRLRARLVSNGQGHPLRIDGISSDITELKQTEIALRASEERFRSLVANVPGVIYRVLPNQTWATVFISDAIEEMTGYQAQAFLDDAQLWHKIIHHQDLPRIRQIINQAIGRRQAYAFEARIFCADGQMRWIYERGQGMWDPWGNLLYLDGAIVDLTDRKQNEEILQRQAQRDRLLTTLTQRIRESLNLEEILDRTVREVRHSLKADRVIIVRLQGLAGSQVVSESVELPYRDTLGLNFYDTELPQVCYQEYAQGQPRVMIEPDLHCHYGTCMSLLGTMQVRSQVVVPILHPSALGENLWGLLIAHQCSQPRHWLDWEVEMLRQLADQVSIAIGQANLYTQVQQSETRLRTMFDQAAVGMAILDPQGQICQQNHTLTQILGPHQPILQLEAFAADADVRLSEREWEQGYHRCDGSWVWVQLNLSSFPEEGELAGYFLAIVQDVSDRKRAELRLQQQLNFETALARFSSRLTSNEAADWTHLLGLLGRSLNANRVHITHLDWTANSASWIGEWAEETVPLFLDHVQNIPLNELDWWLEQLQQNRDFLLRQVDELPHEATAERQLLQNMGVQSILEVPIWDRLGRLWGCLGVSMTRSSSRHWSDEEARLLRVVGEIIYNYCDRRRVEQALRDSEERFRVTFEQAAVGIAQLDFQGNFLRVNRRYCNLLGYEPEELLQLNMADILHPNDLPESLDSLQQMQLGTLGSCSREKRQRRRDGSWRWAQVTAQVVVEGTDPKYVICAAADIHDRKQYQAALERLRHRYELILNAAGEGICEINLRQQVAFCNPTAARMLGSDHVAEIIGLSLYDIISPPQSSQESPKAEAASPPFWQQMWQTQVSELEQCNLPGTSPTIHQAQFCRLDGSTFPVDYICTPIVLNGQHLGAVLTFKDISERLAIEKLKNEFLSMVSHELRTPLTPMQVALGLLNSGKLGPLSEKGQHLVSIALSNTNRLRRLIDDLLDFQRLESGRVEINRQHHPLLALLQQSLDTMRAMAEQDDIGLEIVPKTEDLREYLVWADGDLLIQVLTNLISNAIKFSPPGAVVSFGLRDWSQPGEICLQVCDRGRGIPPNSLEQVFDPFHQVDTSDSRKKGGTGLGLTICRRIIEQHGGRIWAENLPGGGTRISLTLPETRPDGGPTSPP
ncbi:MAG: PAS domain S-box protein [Sodalinema sp.]|uniref:PAS domain S-box protein n=1 Tax=Sodalinema sp. TaxID=3080550 RepID=UPI00396F3B1A